MSGTGSKPDTASHVHTRPSTLPLGPLAWFDGAPAIFADHRLALAVLKALGKNPGQPIRLNELAYVTELTARSGHLVDLGGIEQLINLEVLDLSHNKIADFSPLAGLSNLTTLMLIGNSIEDISFLSSHAGLERLDLGLNEIKDATPLAPLTSLTHL